MVEGGEGRAQVSVVGKWVTHIIVASYRVLGPLASPSEMQALEAEQRTVNFLKYESGFYERSRSRLSS